MLTYAGQPLLLPDSAGQLTEWMEAFQELSRASHFTDPYWVGSSQNGTRGDNTSGVGLGEPKWPPTPVAKLNWLYFPTGATRWTRGYFIADITSLGKIVKATNSYEDAATLVIDEWETSLYLVNPMPIDAYGGAWLLPLVDARYFWQFSSSGDLVAAADESNWTWEKVAQFVSGKVKGGNSSISFTPDEEYKKPDKIELSRRNHNCATLLDAIASSCMGRFVLSKSGISKFQNGYDAKLAVDGRSTANIIAGGSSPAKVTANSIAVSFPKYTNGKIWNDGVVEKTEGVSSSDGLSAKLLIKSTLCALRNSSDTSSTNDDDLIALTSKIATDIEGWIAVHDYDITFAGVPKTLDICGADDCIEISFGSQRKEGEEFRYEACTRVRSLPATAGWGQNLSQNENLIFLSHFQRCKAYESIASDSNGLVRIYDGAGVLSTDQITVHNDSGATVTENAIGYIHWHEESHQWRILRTGGSGNGATTIAIVVDATIDSFATGNVLLWNVDTNEYDIEAEVFNVTRPVFEDEGVIIGSSNDGRAYIVNTQTHVLDGVAYEDIAQGASGQVELTPVPGSGTQQITAKAKFNRVNEDEQLKVVWDENLDEWHILSRGMVRQAKIAGTNTDDVIGSTNDGDILIWDGTGYTIEAVAHNFTRPVFEDELITVIDGDNEEKPFIINTHQHVLSGETYAAIAKNATGDVLLDNTIHVDAVARYKAYASGDKVSVAWDEDNNEWVIIAPTGAVNTATSPIKITGVDISFDYPNISGYSGSAIQVLGHDASGVLKWYSKEDC